MGNYPSVGLALGGGFLRGAAHIGVLKVLLQENVPVYTVAGSSSGSIVASLFAAGYSPDKIKELTTALEPQDVFDGASSFRNMFFLTVGTMLEKFSLPFPFRIPTGIMKGKRLERTVENMMGNLKYFSQLRELCLVVTAVDIRSGSQILFMPGGFQIKDVHQLTVIPPKDIEVISDVPIAAAVRASCSVPGLFEPKKIREKVLVDGGVRDNIPVEVLKKMDMDLVIAVDVGYDGQVVHKVDTITQVLTQSVDIMGSESTLMKLDAFADLVIRPEIKDVAIWDFDRIDYCIRKGEEKAREMVSEIRRAIWAKKAQKRG